MSNGGRSFPDAGAVRSNVFGGSGQCSQGLPLGAQLRAIYLTADRAQWPALRRCVQVQSSFCSPDACQHGTCISAYMAHPDPSAAGQFAVDPYLLGLN
eukprot:SAG31_NODE_1310_length_8870_cov_2.332231_10_plen_98_part_00